ncbi:uncharacterized protein E5676_scaffold13G003350 [Cucumis melo var. makuwa]|uniref:Uncharacterized protein n=1 Tax=Cucumis melo var. makuwa TaxID=1194695 RepID=A0A5D3C9K6_CUCMM|nr:uncharacterized protein E5676_scaffold13G003350 [Cucumis melo var. makuwa]
MVKIPVNVRTSDEDSDLMSGTASFSDVFFRYLEDGETSSGNFCNSDDEEEENSFDVKESKAFWNSQGELLQTTLRRTSSIESRIRRATAEILREISIESTICECGTSPSGSCRNCWQREICNRLRITGLNCAVCKSKWRSSSDIPSGEHSYLEVLDNSNSRRGEVRVVIELNFRAEFEMARANEEYNKLIRRLPEVFVGKSERLWSLIKILCTAAKRCTKEKKMHLAPWRKQKYIQSKWLGRRERERAATVMVPLPVSYSDRPAKSKASMLTFDLLDNLGGLHCTAVEVV